MSAKTLSLKIIEIVGDNPDGFDETKEQQVKELLKSVNHETDIKKVEWRERKSSW
jgi:flavin-binding protein dodecin